jgi:hypothetical protein
MHASFARPFNVAASDRTLDPRRESLILREKEEIAVICTGQQ